MKNKVLARLRTNLERSEECETGMSEAVTTALLIFGGIVLVGALIWVGYNFVNRGKKNANDSMEQIEKEMKDFRSNTEFKP